MGQLIRAARVALSGGEPEVADRRALLRCVAEGKITDPEELAGILTPHVTPAP